MKLILGLGNIGDKYLYTRHNVGFMIVDYLALNNSVDFRENSKLKSILSKCIINGRDMLLVKPTTYMNLSGEALRAVMDYYKISVEDIIVVYDDISLELGKIRFRASGSDGGHNGIKSVIQHLGTNKFMRLKVGIGPQPNIPSEAYVLQNFPKEQLEDLKSVIKTSTEAILYSFDNGIDNAQNKYN